MSIGVGVVSSKISGVTLGERLRSLRMNSQKTLKEQGYIFGVSINSVYRWEHDITVPRKSLLNKVAQFYEVPLEWLLTGKGVETLGEARFTLTSKENHLLEMYRKLSENNKYKTLGYVECVYVENKEPSTRDIQKTFQE